MTASSVDPLTGGAQRGMVFYLAVKDPMTATMGLGTDFARGQDVVDVSALQPTAEGRDSRP